MMPNVSIHPTTKRLNLALLGTPGYVGYHIPRLVDIQLHA
jgi:hypothetical protein